MNSSIEIPDVDRQACRRDRVCSFKNNTLLSVRTGVLDAA